MSLFPRNRKPGVSRILFLSRPLRLLALLALLCLCPAKAGEQTILRVFTWSEFFSPSVLADFEERHGCIVAIDLFDSNEAMLADVLARGGGYDLVTPSSYMVEEMHRRGLLLPVEHAQVANLSRIDPAFLVMTEDPAMAHSVPYTRTVTGVGYRKSRLGDLTEGERTWAVFSRRDLAGRMTMLDDMRESMGAALKYLGYSLNSTDQAELEAAGRLLEDWRANLADFKVDEANIGLGAGEYDAVHGYNGDLSLLMAENDDVDFFVPAEGSAVTTDHFVVLADSRQASLAHAFINHLLDPRQAAVNMADIQYYMPIPEAVELLPPAIRENPAFSVPPEVLRKCEVIRDLGEDTARYEAIWRAIRGDDNG